MYQNPLKNLSKFEWCLWIGSMTILISTFFIVKEKDYINLALSLLGVTMLILLSKGDVIGHFIGIVFAILYAIVSYKYKYYGEMITFLCMNLPLSVFSLISWFKNPHNGSRNEVKVAHMTNKKWLICILSSIFVTTALFFALKALNTPNLIISTISITTSCFAAILCIYRSPYYGLGYAANDIVLVILWSLASIKNPQYIALAINFSIFLINDLYGFLNWIRIRKRQSKIQSLN